MIILKYTYRERKIMGCGGILEAWCGRIEMNINYSVN